MNVSQADFVAWKNDPVTKFIFKYLESAKEFSLERMVSRELLNNANALLTLNHLRGYVDAIDDLLNIDSAITEEGENESSEGSGV